MITIEKITKNFKENMIFKDYDCVIKDNDFVAITGVSGCGKTTLLNLLGLIDLDYRGNIFYDDINIHSLNKAKQTEFIRNHINYLFQNFALIDDDSVEDNLLLALYYVKAKKDEKCKMIQETLDKLGLLHLLKKKVYALSGGEQQRIALARVMLKPGDIILADEPTGNLDEENKNIVMKELTELHNAGKTIIIVTHDHDVANRCNTIINLGHPNTQQENDF